MQPLAVAQTFKELKWGTCVQQVSNKPGVLINIS
jgi:hypothetical protein